MAAVSTSTLTKSKTDEFDLELGHDCQIRKYTQQEFKSSSPFSCSICRDGMSTVLERNSGGEN